MKKTLISDNWLFRKFNPGIRTTENDTTLHKIDLPHDFAISQPRTPDAQGQWGNGFFNGGIGIYSKFINFGKREHTILHIDGAYMCAEIKMNENLLAIHPHGYTPFLVDLTDTIMWNNVNKIEIQTNDMQPSSRWYTGAGIYRDVYLWAGGDVRIEPWDLYVVTNSANNDKANITVKSHISSDIDTNAEVEIKITDSKGNITLSHTETVKVKQQNKTPEDFNFEIHNPILWDLENPHLYTIDVTIKVMGEVVDTFTQNFGIREIKFTAKDGFTLNGKTVKLQGGCIHHDHCALGTRAYPSAEERKIKLLKSAGFNSLRLSHNPASDLFMEICDREGILLMDEAFDMWGTYKRAGDYHLWFNDWWARDISYMVLRDRSHPSIISYSIGNEIPEAMGRSQGVRWSEKLSNEIRKYDVSRPVTCAICAAVDIFEDSEPTSPTEYQKAYYYNTNDQETGYCTKKDPESDWSIPTTEFMSHLDIIGYNYLYLKYDIDCKRYPDRIIWGSETHAIDIWHSWKKVMKHNNVLGDYTWTAFDNLGEISAGRVEWSDTEKPITLIINDYNWRSSWQGDFELTGFRRPQSYFREMVWRGKSELKIFTFHPETNGKVMNGTKWHWYDVHESWTFDEKYLGEKVKVQVYTNTDYVEFSLNGEFVGKASPVDGIATYDIPYYPGELVATTFKNDTAQDKAILKTTASPYKIVLEPEKETIKADGRDLCYIRIYVTDINGDRIPYDKSELKCSVSGGELMGIFSGDPQSKDQYTSDTCHAFGGRAIVVVKSKESGKIKITITSEGLIEAHTEIECK